MLDKFNSVTTHYTLLKGCLVSAEVCTMPNADVVTKMFFVFALSRDFLSMNDFVSAFFFLDSSSHCHPSKMGLERFDFQSRRSKGLPFQLCKIAFTVGGVVLMWLSTFKYGSSHVF